MTQSTRRALAAALVWSLAAGLACGPASCLHAQALMEAPDPLVYGIYGFRTAPGLCLPYVAGIYAGGSADQGRLEGPGLAASAAAARFDTAGCPPVLLFFFNAEMVSSRTALEGLESLRKECGDGLFIMGLSTSPLSLVKAKMAGLELGFPVFAASGYARELGLEGDFSWALLAPGGSVVALREGRFDWTSPLGKELAALFMARFGSR